MPGPFHGLDLASRALRSFQRALDVTGHNIANVNTRGYSRQTVDFVQTDPTYFYNGGRQALGTGVSIASVNRIRDLFLDGRMLGATGDQSRYGTLTAQLSRIQDVYQEPGPTGLAASLDKFFDSWSGLASNPNEPAMRLQVRQSAQVLADRIRGAYAEFTTHEADLRTSTMTLFDRVDTLSQQIDRLNKEIRAQTALGGVPNDLLDQRDLAVESLGNLVPVTSEQNTDGTVNVTMGGFQLVDQSAANKVPRNYDPVNQTLTDPQNNVFQIRSGELAGLFQSLQQVRTQKTGLDTLANTLRTQTNTLHLAGTNPNGTTNVAFFADANPQTGAIDFDLSTAVKTDVRNIASSATGAAGDGSLALQMSQMRSVSVAALGNKTFGQYHADRMAALGNDRAYFSSALDTQIAVVEQIENQRQAVSGVSLDDEMANLMRFQRSYQAAAKLVSIFDQSVQDLLGMLNR